MLKLILKWKKKILSLFLVFIFLLFSNDDVLHNDSSLPSLDTK